MTFLKKSNENISADIIAEYNVSYMNTKQKDMENVNNRLNKKLNRITNKTTNRNSGIGEIPIWPFTLIVGIIFLVIGFNNGQLEDIYHKAVMICLECIGIG